MKQRNQNKWKGKRCVLLIRKGKTWIWKSWVNGCQLNCFLVSLPLLQISLKAVTAKHCLASTLSTPTRQTNSWKVSPANAKHSSGPINASYLSCLEVHKINEIVQLDSIRFATPPPVNAKTSPVFVKRNKKNQTETRQELLLSWEVTFG